MRPTKYRAVRQKVPESGVLRACLDLLAAEKIWHRRWNTGAVKTGKRFFRFGKSGDGDILASPKQTMAFNSIDPFRPRLEAVPLYLWIECKSDSGEQTDAQIEFEKEVSEEGHHYLLVRDVDTLRRWLIEHGCFSTKQ